MNHNMKMKHNMMKKLSSEKRNVDSEDPDREAAGGGIGSDLDDINKAIVIINQSINQDLDALVQQPTTPHDTLVEGDEESLNIQLMQRMQVMHDLEDEIKKNLLIKNYARTFATGATKESVEDDRMEEVRLNIILLHAKRTANSKRMQSSAIDIAICNISNISFCRFHNFFYNS